MSEVRQHDSLADRLKSSDSWVQETFRSIEGACLHATKNGRWRDSSRGEGRLFYVGMNARPFCRIDPKRRYIGLGFTNIVRDQVARLLSLRANRLDMAWVFVHPETDLGSIVHLIGQAANALRSDGLASKS